MINLDSVLTQLRDAGLQVDHLEPDGRMHRCRVEGMDRENRGWYCLHEWRGGDGNLYLVGSYGVWAGNDNGATKVKLSGVAMSDAEKAALRQRMKEDRKRASVDRAREAETAARRAEAMWKKLALRAPAVGECLYLERKQLGWHAGLRFTDSGAIVVPMMDARSSIRGLQFILPPDHPRRQKIKRDKEYWPAGVQKQGHWFQLGMVAHGGVCLVCEGLATGLSLHEATALPVAVAFDAGNLRHVAAAIKKASGTSRLLICGDDDYLQKCRACRKPTPVADKLCAHCGEAHGAENAGARDAAAAALQVGGAWVLPAFSEDRNGLKLTDFNDLHQREGLQLVRQQISDRLAELQWWAGAPARGASSHKGGGESGRMLSRITIEDAVARYWGTYGFGGDMVFDEIERRLVHKKDLINLLPRHGWDTLKDHPAWRVAHDYQVGFDPTEKDRTVLCNLFGGWPMTPKPGKCTALLSLLEYLCSGEVNREPVFQWVLKWLAYPLQHPGAKMHSAIVVHGGQGTGKSRFFEAYGKIFGPYSRVLGQEALEDKFNADWAQAKLFIIGDEILARQELYHIKNRLKGFITGDTIRVNPKNIAAHNEKNQMNLVFLSNERQPLVLENDDRRHLVIWAPPKLGDAFFDEVNREIEQGGVEALYHYLLALDLGDFRPWTRPPMTDAKEDLIALGLSNEERFVREWCALELQGPDGEPLPFCPCLGSHLYQAYGAWCERNGERKRKAQDLIGLAKKLPGWRAGIAERTHVSLREVDAAHYVTRKLIVPSEAAMRESVTANADIQRPLLQGAAETKSCWLTRCFFAFERALGVPP